MGCRKIKSRLIDYYENSLPPDERKLVESHLEICSDCQEEFQKIRSTFELFKQESSSEPDEQYWVNFVPGVRSKIEKKAETKILPVPGWKIASALVSLGLILLLGVFLFSEDRKVMFKSDLEPYTYLLPESDEGIDQSLYAEIEDESSVSSLFNENDKNKLSMAEEELGESYWGKGGKEKTLEELDSRQLEDLKMALEKTKFEKEIL